MQVRRDDVFVPCAFVLVAYIVTSATDDLAERSNRLVQKCLSTMVLVTNDFAKFITRKGDISNHALGTSSRLEWQYANSTNFLARVGDKSSSK